MDVKVPHLAESVTEGDIGTWLKKDGERVEKHEPILELQTDKAALEISAEAAGVLRVLVQEGETVTVGDVIARIEEGPAAATAPPKPAPTATSLATASAKQEPPAPGRPAPPPPAPAPARPAPPERHSPVAAAAARRSPGPAPLAALPSTPDQPGTRREKMTRVRRSIAARLVEAQRTAAILTTFNEVDMSAVLDLRRQNQEWFQRRHGVKLGFMSIFGRTIVAALKDHPELNAFIEGDEVLYHDHVHLGIAVGTERGLVVPVVRNAHAMGLGELEASIQRLAALAREGRLSLDDLTGGTFTLSNGGVYGSLLSTPILNPPQTGILGMHATQQRPVVLADGSIVARPMMYVALSYDHRLVDGEGAVTFLVKVKRLLEDPDRMLLEG